MRKGRVHAGMRESASQSFTRHIYDVAPPTKKHNMKITQTLLHSGLFLFLVFGLACSPSKKMAKANTPEKLIIGKWILESVTYAGQELPASLMGGEIYFEFLTDGTAKFSTPDGGLETGKYLIKDNQILDPEEPTADPVNIVDLTHEVLVISMVEEGETTQMKFVPSGKE